MLTKICNDIKPNQKIWNKRIKRLFHQNKDTKQTLLMIEEKELSNYHIVLEINWRKKIITNKP